MADWWNQAAVEEAAKKAALDAISEYSEGVMRASRALVPMNKDKWMAWHKGTLRYSGVSERDDTGVTLRYSVDERFNYALLQHEETSFDHETGTHHYLSGPFERLAQSPKFFRFVESRVRARLRSGT